ncbi:MAG TPA: M48 family metalloprotease [Planctomycetota bacterium]|nr:M48 family metalloprotease [Planctomycetota bacterium]
MSRPTAFVGGALGAAGLLAALAAGALTSGCTQEQITRGIQTAGKVAQAIKPFSWSEEKEIGGTIAAKVAGSNPVVSDRRANAYVNLVAQTVASRSATPDIFPRVGIVRDEVPNAYACPSGYIFVTTGLLRTCRDESELAGVLGHEFVHVAKRHTTNELRWKRGMSCAAEEAAKYGPGQIQEMYPGFKGIVDQGINGVVNNRHGDKAEEEADLLGAEWAARAGYDGAGLGRFIERLPGGASGRWKEFAVYKDGTTRAQRIAANMAGLKLHAGGAANAERYKREVAGAL